MSNAKPRVWHKGGTIPRSVCRMTDVDGDEWQRNDHDPLSYWWIFAPGGKRTELRKTEYELLRENAPLTEVLVGSRAVSR